jgi:type IV pilus assembly protein PilA
MRARLNRSGGEDGFTLLEMLVVVLIVGILATIALPSFLNQVSKASDASAQELAHQAQLAAEDYATDNDGSYTGLTAAALSRYDATIHTSAGNGDAYVLSVTNATATGYEVTTASPNGDATFTVNRTGGVITRTCMPADAVKGGCVDGSW